MKLSGFVFRNLMIGLAIAFAVCSPAAHARDDARPAVLSAEDQTALRRIESYLDGIKTLSAQFEQTNQDGSTEAGIVYMSRPGRMRFEYQPPVKMLIISNGDYVAVDDQELKQVQFYPVDSTPVWFLLREGIKLSGDVTVERLERNEGVLRVTCAQTKDPNAGSITLVFTQSPLALRQWTVVDQQGHRTGVSLDNVDTGATLDPALFRLPAAQSPARNPGRNR
jgi:outer membrane lipoprotein-sorting protein